MLVTYPLDAMSTETVQQQCGALQCLTSGHFAAGEQLFHVIPTTDSPCGACGQRNTTVGIARTELLLQYLFHRVTRDLIVPQVIAKLIKLVKDDNIIPGLTQFPTLVKNLFNVALTARGGDYLTGNLG